jgi:hypothetical protein
MYQKKAIVYLFKSLQQKYKGVVALANIFKEKV